MAQHNALILVNMGKFRDFDIYSLFPRYVELKYDQPWHNVTRMQKVNHDICRKKLLW